MKKLFVCALAVAMVFAFTAPTMAADWNFYGSARMGTWSNDKDTKVPGSDSDTDTTWGLQGNSRVGANVAAGDVAGRFEYGVTNQGMTSHYAARVRLLYGTWNFGAGTLLVGRAYSPINNFYSNQVYDGDQNLLPYGMGYRGRVPQIALKFGGFDIAFLEPVAGEKIMAGSTVAGDTDTTLPQVEMSYKFATDMFEVKPYLGWGTYDVQTLGTANDANESIDSLLYGIAGKVNFGPAYVAANFWMGTNAGDYGMWMSEPAKASIDATGKVVDVDTMAYALVVGFKASDMFTIEGGYAASENEMDIATDNEDTSASYYINCVINLAPGVFIVPEFGVNDLDEMKMGTTTTEQTETTYFGAKWQINF